MVAIKGVILGLGRYVKYLSCEPEDLSSIPDTHVKADVVVYSWNASLWSQVCGIP